jgi:hypothetical protein
LLCDWLGRIQAKLPEGHRAQADSFLEAGVETLRGGPCREQFACSLCVQNNHLLAEFEFKLLPMLLLCNSTQKLSNTAPSRANA